MPHARGWCARDARFIDARLPEERHDRQESPIARAPDPDAIGIDEAQRLQVFDAAVQILHVDAAVVEANRIAKLPAVSPALMEIDVEEHEPLLREILVEAPRRMRRAPAPLVPHGVVVDGAEDGGILPARVEIRRQGQSSVQRRPIGAGLLEGGQHDRSASALEGFGKVSVRRCVGGRGEVDIERDVLDVCLLKLPDQLGVEQARPWPDADPVDR